MRTYVHIVTPRLPLGTSQLNYASSKYERVHIYIIYIYVRTYMYITCMDFTLCFARAEMHAACMCACTYIDEHYYACMYVSMHMYIYTM